MPVPVSATSTRRLWDVSVSETRDTKLDRDVAIKVLPEAFAADPERIARFQREAKMVSSKQLAGLVGPAIVAMIASEFPLVQPHLYDEQIPSVLYLSGVLMFVAGLAITRAHNRCAWDWTVLVTMAGWFATISDSPSRWISSRRSAGGKNFPKLSRMMVAEVSPVSPEATSTQVVYKVITNRTNR